MLTNIVAFYNLAQQAVEHTSQSDNKITWAVIKDNLADIILQLTRMKFKVNYSLVPRSIQKIGEKGLVSTVCACT